MTLAWSRHQYAEFVRNQKVETWLACHRHAFEWFNGVPLTVRIDNPKCAITRACYYEPEVQRAYGELALGYRFASTRVPPRDRRKKGRVESGVKYVKSSFVPLREFHSLEHANEQLRAWVMGEAGNRIHGTTRERPLTLFAETEQALLQPLPAIAPECPAWAKAKLHRNCHVQFEYCYYSAPFALIGQDVVARDRPQCAAHLPRPRTGRRSSAAVQARQPIHRRTIICRPMRWPILMRDPQWCLAQASGGRARPAWRWSRVCSATACSITCAPRRAAAPARELRRPSGSKPPAPGR